MSGGEEINPNATRDMLIMAVLTLIFIVGFIYVNQKRKDMETAGPGDTLDVITVLNDSSLRNVCIFMLLVLIVTLGFSLYLAVMSGVDILSGFVYAGISAALFYALLQAFDAFTSISVSSASSDMDGTFSAILTFESTLSLASAIVFGCALIALLRKYGAEMRAKIASFTKEKHAAVPGVTGVVPQVTGSKVPVASSVAGSATSPAASASPVSEPSVLGSATNALLGICRQAAVRGTLPQ